jgi:plasmid stabilization system protein ParE
VKQIIWSKQADADFDQAYRHASELGQNHADRLLDRLDEAHATLARYPPAGVMMANSGFRKWLLWPAV